MTHSALSKYLFWKKRRVRRLSSTLSFTASWFYGRAKRYTREHCDYIFEKRCPRHLSRSTSSSSESFQERHFAIWMPIGWDLLERQIKAYYLPLLSLTSSFSLYISLFPFLFSIFLFFLILFFLPDLCPIIHTYLCINVECMWEHVSRLIG